MVGKGSVMELMVWGELVKGKENEAKSFLHKVNSPGIKVLILKEQNHGTTWSHDWENFWCREGDQIEDKTVYLTPYTIKTFHIKYNHL